MDGWISDKISPVDNCRWRPTIDLEFKNPNQLKDVNVFPELVVSAART